MPRFNGTIFFAPVLGTTLVFSWPNGAPKNSGTLMKSEGAAGCPSNGDHPGIVNGFHEAGCERPRRSARGLG